MLEEIRRLIREALDRRAGEQARIDDAVAAADAENRSEFTDDEQTAFNEARAAITAIDAELEEMRAREAELVEIAERRQAADGIAAELGEQPSEQRRVVVTVDQPAR